MADTEPEDEILKQLGDIQKEGKDAFQAFQKRVTAKAFTDVNELAVELKDLFSMFLDFTALTTSAIAENIDWSSGVDDELDVLREGLPAGSQLVPTDAENLSQLLSALRDNLRGPSVSVTDPAALADQEFLELLKTRATQALAFIEEITMEPEEETEQDDDEETE